MPMTQAQAMAAVRSRLDEPTSVYWTDTDLRRWINEIAFDLARRTESLRGYYDQPVVATTYSYTPAFTSTTGPFRINNVEFIPTGQSLVYPMEYRDRTAMAEIWGLSQANNEGIPAVWTSWNAPPNLSIQIYPSPSLAGVLRIWYYRQPTELSISTSADANTEIEVVEGWSDVLVDGVEYKAKRRDSDPDWQAAKQEYEQHLEAMVEATTRFTDAAGVVTTPGGSYIPTWLYGGGADFW